MKHLLIYPMALYILGMWCLTVYLFKSRVRAIKTKEVDFKYYKTHTGGTPSDRTILIGRHFDNQFQVPILFLITCVFHFSVGMVNELTLILVWGFVLSRVLHSLIHLGANNLRKRVAAYGLGWILILGLWLQLTYFATQISN